MNPSIWWNSKRPSGFWTLLTWKFVWKLVLSQKKSQATPSKIATRHRDFKPNTVSAAKFYGIFTRMFPKIVGFPPKSSILIGFSIIFTIHFGVSLFFGNIHTEKIRRLPWNKIEKTLARHCWQARSALGRRRRLKSKHGPLRNCLDHPM